MNLVQFKRHDGDGDVFRRGFGCSRRRPVRNSIRRSSPESSSPDSRRPPRSHLRPSRSRRCVPARSPGCSRPRRIDEPGAHRHRKLLFRHQSWRGVSSPSASLRPRTAATVPCRRHRQPACRRPATARRHRTPHIRAPREPPDPATGTPTTPTAAAGPPPATRSRTARSSTPPESSGAVNRRRRHPHDRLGRCAAPGTRPPRTAPADGVPHQPRPASPRGSRRRPVRSRTARGPIEHIVQCLDQLRGRPARSTQEARRCTAASSLRPPEPRHVKRRPARRDRNLDVRARENIGSTVRTRRRQRQPNVDRELRQAAQALPHHCLPVLRKHRRQMPPEKPASVHVSTTRRTTSSVPADSSSQRRTSPAFSAQRSDEIDATTPHLNRW